MNFYYFPCGVFWTSRQVIKYLFENGFILVWGLGCKELGKDLEKESARTREGMAELTEPLDSLSGLTELTEH